MKKILFTRQGLMVSLALASIMVLVAIYLFQYVPENESNLKARRFRALERTQLNLQNKINNSFQFLETQLRCYTDSANNDTVRMNNYLDSLNNREIFTLSAVKKQPAGEQVATNSRQISFDADSINCSFLLPHDSSTYQLKISYSLESFVQSLLPRNLFDEFILVRDSAVLFASFPTGNQKILKDTSLEFSAALPVSSEGSVQLAGQEYRIFLQPLKLDRQSNWVLGGLLQEKRFLQERYQLDPKKVLSLITVSIILLILLPWFKLFFMGSRDRLTHADGFLSYLVAMFLMCMLFFVFARELPLQVEDKSLQVLSDNIGSAFKQEISNAKALLVRCDEAIVQNESLRHDLVCVSDTCVPAIAAGFGLPKPRKDTVRENRPLDSASLDTLKKLFGTAQPKVKLNQVYWLDNKGNEVYNWSAKRMVRPHQNFSERRYFTTIKNSKNHEDTATEQVISWTTGDFRTVISMRSKLGDTVAAISFNVPAMENHLLPEGFIAMIINWRGEVLYDTDASDNLNEYLPEEFADSTHLKSAIYAGTTEEFVTSYLGSKYYVRFSPLNQGYFLLLLKNQSFENTRDINAFSFALLMYAVFFGIILLQFICMVSLFSPRSSLKYKMHWIDTLFPSRALQGAYRYAAAGNFTIIALLIPFGRLSLLAHIYILLSAIAMDTIYINLVCAQLHSLSGNVRKAATKQKNALIVAAFLLLYNLFAIQLYKSEELGSFFLFEVVALVLLGLLYAHCCYTKTTAVPPGTKPARFINSYTWMAVSRMIITSGIPVLFFYVDGYNYEQTLQNRHAQKLFGYRFARMLKFTDSNKAIASRSIFIDNALINNYGYWPVDTGHASLDTTSYQGYKVYDLLRIWDDTVSMANNNLYHNKVANDEGAFYENNRFKRSLPGRPGVISVSSSFNRLQPFPWINSTNWKLWVVLLLLLAVYYQVVQRILGKIFAIDFTPQSTATDIHHAQDLALHTALPADLPNGQLVCPANDHRFNVIIAAPGCGAMDDLHYLRKERSVSPGSFVLDLRVAWHKNKSTGLNAFDKAGKQPYHCLFITHLEYILHDVNLYVPLISLLKYRMHRPTGAISILSAIHPADLQDHLKESLQHINAIDPKKAAVVMARADQLQSLLQQYSIAYMGMRALAANKHTRNLLLQFLQRELYHGDFLHACYTTYKNEIIPPRSHKAHKPANEVPSFQ